MRGREAWTFMRALNAARERLGPNPMVSLNRAVAVAMGHGPAAGLDR